MARIAILTCANTTQETNCASVGCLRDMRERNGYFQSYPSEEPLELVGMISCAGCPTIVAPEKILKRVAAVAEYDIEALHFAWCIEHFCPFVSKYQKIVQQAYPNLRIVLGTHPESEEKVKVFRHALKEILAPTVQPPQDMNDVVKRRFKFPESPSNS